MMKWLDYFTIRQKLAALLFFLLSTVSYIVINTISDTNQHKQSNIQIEIAQQQHLIVEQFINAFFFARQQALISGDKTNSSEIKKNQFLFEQNLKALLYGGKTYLDLNMKNSIHLTAITPASIREEIKTSQNLWKKLQSASQSLPVHSMTIEQLSIFHHLSNNLREKLTTIATLLIKQRDKAEDTNLLTLQLSWLFILITGTFFAWLIARNITQPLDNIAKVTSRIRLGDLQSYPEKNTHHDELGTLFYQADEMRLVLSDLMLTIQQHNKQMVHSSHQVSQLSGEMHSLHQLQFNQHDNVIEQLTSLQKGYKAQLKHLSEHSSSQTKNQDIIDNYWQKLLVNLNTIEDIQNSNQISLATFNQLKQSAEKLDESLLSIENIALKTQDLARKKTIDAARSGQQSEQFTLVANQVTHLATKTANHIAQISPLLKQFKSQLNELSIPLNYNEQQLQTSQQEFIHSNEIFESLKSEFEKQKYNTRTLVADNEQQDTNILSIFNVLKSSLDLIKESSEKSDANTLFVQDLSKISVQLEALSHQYKLDDKENRARRGNDKRVYPRINNQLQVSLQQADTSLQGLTQDISLSGLQLKSMESVRFNHRTPVTFTLTPPNINPENSEQAVTLLGDVVHYEQLEESYFYGVRFQPLSEADKNKLQQIFDYFEKKSEFKN